MRTHCDSWKVSKASIQDGSVLAGGHESSRKHFGRGKRRTTKNEKYLFRKNKHDANVCRVRHIERYSIAKVRMWS